MDAQRLSDFWTFNANSIALTAIVAVTFVVFHELAQLVVRLIKSAVNKKK
ncbi:MAG TPA: hypothetical protein PLZ24_14700 [Flavobacteriales bacterium]|nr:hypothetical protein [Flavobacteriales bacterium]